MKLRKTSAWSREQVEDFLRTARIPARLACNTGGGFPLLCSLWYEYDDGAIWCAVHADSRLAQLLGEDPRCAFEVAPNDPPYRGVRGQGRVQLLPGRGEEVLGSLIDRFLGDRRSSLARWLLSRSDEELAVRIDPVWISSWDYSDRMSA